MSISAREIVIDTETTGLDPNSGDRLIELCCIELKNKVKTGRVFHSYINPQRNVSPGAFNVHGISSEFLRDKPLFAEIIDDFLEFIQDSHLVIHNAPFDLKFLNAELNGRLVLPEPNMMIIDTLAIARKMFPGSPASLDALCKRFRINSSKRDKHGAHVDAELLVEVYIALMGGKQIMMDFMQPANYRAYEKSNNTKQSKRFPIRKYSNTQEELESHRVFIKQNIKDPVWETYD